MCEEQGRYKFKGGYVGASGVLWGKQSRHKGVLGKNYQGGSGELVRGRRGLDGCVDGWERWGVFTRTLLVSLLYMSEFEAKQCRSSFLSRF